MLLILAGVALATLTGQGNIIGNAENAVGKYNNSVAGEQQLLNEIEKYFQNYLEEGNGDNPPTPPEPVDKNGLATENTIITTDEENVQIVIPKGFAPAILTGSNSTYSLPGQDGSVKEIMPYEQWSSITAEQINQGIVIVDHAVTYTEGVPDFNEYVWISIPNCKENFKRTEWTTLLGYDENGELGSGERKHLLAEMETVNRFWEETTTQEYQNMIDSVEYYKGFYIGRYEASEDTENIAQSKRARLPWGGISQQEIITACKNNNDKTENMHLMYGIEYDSVLNWLIGKAIISSPVEGEQKTMELADIQTDSGSWGNYATSKGDAGINNGKPQNTGASEYWKANNIYDLAGNVCEWTQEKYSTDTGRVLRNGYYYGKGTEKSAANRYVKNHDITADNFGFRSSFFVSLDAGSDA